MPRIITSLLRSTLIGVVLAVVGACCSLPTDESLRTQFEARRPAMEQLIALLDAHPWIVGCRGEFLYQYGTAEEEVRGRALLPAFQEASRGAGLEGGVMRYGGTPPAGETADLPDAYMFTVSNCTQQWDCCEKGYLFSRHPDSEWLGKTVESLERAGEGGGPGRENLRMELAPGWFAYQRKR